MPHNEIKDGALFIADSHYNEERTELLSFLENLLNNPPKQIFFMGDIFDLFIGNFSYLREKNREVVFLIEKLGEKSEIFFFEGNHDFLLEKKIKNIKYIALDNQPCEFVCNDKRVFLSHGDYDEGFLHSVFTALIRNRIFLFLLNFLSLNFFDNRLIKKIATNLKKKELCRSFGDFNSFIEKKIRKNFQNADIVIEGHYHQNCDFFIDKTRYINASSFACNQSFNVVEFSKSGINFITKKYKRA